MPTTTNYGWETPDVNGDLGAWGTILNAAIQDIDTDLKTVADTASAASTAATAAQSTATGAQSTANTALSAVNNKVIVSTAAPTSADVYDNGTLWCQVSA